MTTQPVAPYLVIRRALAYWVEHRPPADCLARLQAFREGCFDDAWCFDATGRIWPIVNARVARRLRLWERISATHWVPIEIELGPHSKPPLPEVVSRLADVLLGPSEFCDHLTEPPEALLQRFEAAGTPEELIRVADEHVA